MTFPHSSLVWIICPVFSFSSSNKLLLKLLKSDGVNTFSRPSTLYDTNPAFCAFTSSVPEFN